ncbi:uncharacterized protein LOC123552599 [Mercenaria mercenaria]|uniref:uncharacterized protein LOC123552599 n=1 Tax=Mercenaria mercenaria TaxID=6596 RepID=UPI00234F028C|nr:uncharacterized protein LOC123552599 [Mercenaria mercenaria]XP_053396116.1 uncharacterized protein LOC123552599 [Mercenaria mercenaria]XP_053396117.1 uncharacterized protein LOC123552599 [Mercenaria mercenaria]XP_053396118.1 uncharacterized protein LOC123552599 [Mercenaria mercenaria]XP_053396119.1 uncharacterized protein LOC123552599 [Mercenaria mercenaria]XP_053396120.1 uncharacterized protein LOC123552599 [Mercenaria mercenaria]
MSAVLLMTDTWQPTVLRLVPFSSNNARCPDKKAHSKGTMSARNFPVLAVTRSSANSDTRSDAKSVNSHRSELADDISVFSDANISELTTNTSYTDQTTTNKQRKKYAKKKVPEVHSEMKEAIKFSVQDLNDQVSSSSSLNSSENKGETKDKNNKLDNTRTKLPKPSICGSPDIRFCSPINGVRRSVPLTPGELELQRIKDSYYVEQVQKRKRYKLNINQLPRSTTPINDHDPDRLNMKHVIAFLQTKTSKDIQKKGMSEKKCQSGTVNVRNQSRDRTRDSLSVSPKRSVEMDNTKVLPRSNTENKLEEKSDPDNTRVNTGCVSVMSTKSTPNMSYGTKSSRDSKVTSTHSVKSYKERSKDRKNSKQKPMKEFKLYRFLAVAPDGRSEGLTTSFSDAMPVVAQTVLRTEPKAPESPRKMLHRRSNREIGTAHVLHRHASSRSTVTPPKIETKESAEEQNKTIRLPLMQDGDTEAADIESDSGSTTSATCNSVQNSSIKEDRSKYPKKGKSITFNNKVDVNVTEQNSENDTRNGYSEFEIQNFKPPGLPRMDIKGPKYIHVSLPQEDKKNYSQEIVRLTLRHEKNATRVTSYMSDIQQSPPPHWHEHYTSENKEDMSRGNMTSLKYMNYHEGKQWFDNSKHLINNISNNNFIKVREKLRATNQYNT